MSKTVMTVDDSRMMRDLLNMVLSKEGYTVVQAENGVDALEALGGASPDAIITDINMPKMDGFELIAGVRGDPKHRATPILVLTTETSKEKKQRARDAGATGWIVKPFDNTALLDALRRVCP